MTSTDRASLDELHQRVVQHVQRFPNFTHWEGSLPSALSILITQLGGTRKISRHIAATKNYTAEEQKELEKQIYALFRHPKSNIEILRLVIDTWAEIEKSIRTKAEDITNKSDDILPPPDVPCVLDPEKPYKEVTDLVNMLVENWDTNIPPTKSLKEGIKILAEKLGSARTLARTLEEENYPRTRETDDEIKKFFYRAVHFIYNGSAPHQSDFDCALRLWQKIATQPKIPLDQPHDEASRLVQHLKKYPDDWEGSLLEAIMILNKTHGGRKGIYNALQHIESFDEKRSLLFKARILDLVLSRGPNYIFKDDLETLLTIWRIALPEKQPKPQYRKAGSIDRTKEYPEATALVRRLPDKQNWTGTLHEALPLLRRTLAGSIVIARMLGLQKDQEQRIEGFIKDSLITRHPRKEDLACALRAWSIILDRMEQGLTSRDLTAPIIVNPDSLHRRSAHTIGSSLKNSNPAKPHNTAKHTPEPAG